MLGIIYNLNMSILKIKWSKNMWNRISIACVIIFMTNTNILAWDKSRRKITICVHLQHKSLSRKKPLIDANHGAIQWVYYGMTFLLCLWHVRKYNWNVCNTTIYYKCILRWCIFTFMVYRWIYYASLVFYS